jgi:hypothetical protein
VLLAVRRIQAIAAHVLAGGRRVDDFAMADVDGDMAVLLAALVEK